MYKYMHLWYTLITVKGTHQRPQRGARTMKDFRFGYRSGYGVYYRIITASSKREAWAKMENAMANLIDGNVHDFWIE